MGFFHKKLLLFLGNRKENNFDLKSSKSFLIRPIGHGIGDAVVLTHFVRNLKKRFPQAAIYVMPGKRNMQVFSGNPYVNKVYPYSFLSFVKLQGRVDVFIDFSTYIKVKNFLFYIILNPKAVITAFRNQKYGLTEKDFSYYRRYKTTDYSRPFSKVFLDLGAELGLSDDGLGYDLYPSAASVGKAKTFWLKGKKRILLNLFGTSKELCFEDVASLVSKIKEKYDADIVLLWDAKTRQQAFSFAADNGIRTAFKTQVSDIFSFAKTADYIISVDTALVHAASAFKKPLLAFFERNIYSQWAPLGDKNDIVFCTVRPKGKRTQYCFDASEAFAAFESRFK